MAGVFTGKVFRPLTPYDMVLEFHKTFGAGINEDIQNDTIRFFREKLIREEEAEVSKELFPLNDIVSKSKLTKELADLMYVTIGTAIAFGLPLEEVFAEVHKSNMSKLTKEGYVLRREDGKVLKSDQYQEPDLEKYF